MDTTNSKINIYNHIFVSSEIQNLIFNVLSFVKLNLGKQGCLLETSVN